MNTFLLWGFITAYIYAAGITCWFLMELDGGDGMQWWLASLIGIFWPLAMIFAIGVLLYLFCKALPHKYQNWKWRQSKEYRLFADELQGEIKENAKKVHSKK